MDENKQTPALEEEPLQVNPLQTDEAQAVTEPLEEKPAFELQSGEDFDFEEAPPLTEEEKRLLEKKARKAAKKERKRRRRGAGLLYICCVLIVCICLACFGFLYVNDYLAILKSDCDIEIEVPQGSTTADIAKILEEEGVIDYAPFFRLYMKLSKEDGSLQYGSYLMNSNLSYERIKQRLQVIQLRETVTLTFPEGMNLLNIASRLVEADVIDDREKFLDYFNRNNFGTEIEKQIPKDAKRFYQMEGFTFPDTYEFYLEESYESVAKKLITNLDTRINANWDVISAGMEKYDMTFVEVMTLASIIQAEAGKKEEMLAVSGVFHNRLANPLSMPRLQSDPTKTYANNIINKYSLVPDPNQLAAYDTYSCVGLPAGPICNPGMDAILAAVTPQAHDYFYFVTDAGGKYYYSKTYAEHQAICRRLGMTWA